MLKDDNNFPMFSDVLLVKNNLSQFKLTITIHLGVVAFDKIIDEEDILVT